MVYCTVVISYLFFWDLRFTHFVVTKGEAYGPITRTTFADGQISVHMFPRMYRTEAHFHEPAYPANCTFVSPCRPLNLLTKTMIFFFIIIDIVWCGNNLLQLHFSICSLLYDVICPVGSLTCRLCRELRWHWQDDICSELRCRFVKNNVGAYS